MRSKFPLARRVTLLPLLVLTVACASLAAPKQLSASGAVAFHANRVVDGIGVLQDVTIKGEAAGVIKTADARAIVTATKVAAQSAVDLAHALQAGATANDARAKYMAAVRAALNDVVAQVDPKTRAEIAPYVTAVLTALELLQ